MNHVVFAHLDGQEPGSHTSQFWVTVLKNTFPAAVVFFLFIGLKVSLSQVALRIMQLDSYPLGLVNLIISPPDFLNTLSMVFKFSLETSIPRFAILATIAQAVALTSLFVPGTLTVVSSPSHTQTLLVPTLDFNIFDPAQSSIYGEAFPVERSHTLPTLQFIGPSQRWQQLVLRAISSNVAPTWSPPVECGSACSYSFSYSAPALNCMQLLKKDIWPSAPDTSDSRLAFPVNSSIKYAFYNLTSSSILSESNTTLMLVLDVIYMPDFNGTILDQSYHANGTGLSQLNKWSPLGVRCSFHNATYKATTQFFNHTQISSTRVEEWQHGFITSFADVVNASTNTTNNTMAFNSIVDSFTTVLQGSLVYEPGYIVRDDNTQVLYTPLFNLTNYPPADNVYTTSGSEEGLEIVTTFSLSPAFGGGDLSAGLQNLFGNVTLAFVSEQMSTTYANVTATPNSTEYQYIGWRLGLIYGVTFSFSLVVVVYALFCLWKNGTLAVFDLQHILEMTASSARLHELAGRPDFRSTLVTGITSSKLDGTRRKITVVLEVSN
ncbi:hypothetical protein D9757_010203 [Collybiopsis confluens]|uniref:Uncharacterized protein n=1 Tax=Collybiopsis confluens TaxID=2823264 RepID=A0A8H5GP75_9AGAR|nr:hypothetical protein D9757_010203 [Collybiopsis confluens]